MGNVQHIIKHRRRYYANLQIPKRLQPHFGKTTFRQSLQTDSLSVAKVRVLPIIHQWKLDLAAAANIAPNSLQSTVNAVRLDKNERAIQEDIALELAVSYDENGNKIYDDTLFTAISIAHGDVILLAEHIDVYLRQANLEQKTIDEKRKHLKEFSERFKTSEDITKVELQRWVDELLEEKKRATVYKIISTYRVFWQWIERRNEIDLGDPFRNVLPKPRRKTKTEVARTRKAFSGDDYHKLITFTSDDQMNDLIKLAAFTGCRIEELCSLKIKNVLGDRLVIENAKSQAGNRIVPIHSEIKQLITRLFDTSVDGFLLSNLSFNKYGDRSNAIGKRFGRMKAKLGYDDRYVFHSIRKMFTSQLEAAGVPETVAARLLGHEITTLSYGLYSSGTTFEVLKNAIERVKYPNH